jgi:hypothetical protein
MDALALVGQARMAGLQLSVAGDKLVVTGSRKASGLVSLIAQHKQAVMQALQELVPVSNCSSSIPVGVTETPQISEYAVGFADGSCVNASARGVPKELPKAHTTHGLIGRGFPPRHTDPPPKSILIDPAILCSSCSKLPVLRELRHMTGGLCWPCWSATGEDRS